MRVTIEVVEQRAKTLTSMRLQEEVVLIHSRYSSVDNGSGLGVSVLRGMGNVGGEESGVVSFSANHNSEQRVIRPSWSTEARERSLHLGHFFIEDDLELSLKRSFQRLVRYVRIKGTTSDTPSR